jgi:hypothetical protein
MKKNPFTLTETTLIITAASGSVRQQNIDAAIPLSISFKSSAAGRKIELSFDGGTNFHQPVYDFTSATELVLATLAPWTACKLTGDIGDTVSISEV